MTEEVAPALAQMLQGQQQLQVLNLNDTSLGEEGIVIIAEALQQSGGLCRAQDLPTLFRKSDRTQPPWLRLCSSQAHLDPSSSCI